MPSAGGLHLAALAGAWLVAVACFGGMRDHGDTLAFAPRLRRLSFRLLYRGRSVRVEVDSDSARYEILDGEPIELVRHGERFVLEPGSPQERELPPAGLKVEPPPGRIPRCATGKPERTTSSQPRQPDGGASTSRTLVRVDLRGSGWNTRLNTRLNGS